LPHPRQQGHQFGLGPSAGAVVERVRLDHAHQGLGLWRQRAEVTHLVATGQQHGGEIFHVQRVQQVGLVFDVDPQKLDMRV